MTKQSADVMKPLLQPSLCAVCSTDGKGKAKLLSISLYVYLKGSGRKVGIQGAPRISICEDCLALETRGAVSPQLWPCVRERLTGVYKATIAERG